MRFGGLIAAIVFAAIAAIIVLRTMGNEQPPAPVGPVVSTDVKTINIFVAAAPIGLGNTVTQESLAVQPWPANLILDGFIKADAGAAQIVGMVARGPFQAQEPVLMSKLANRNDPNFLAGELPKGMRVISIQTNETEGLAGFVFPGDYVDVLLTHSVGTPSAGREKDIVSETLLSNVKVLAVDQRSMGANATDSNGKLLIPRSVSLMVSPENAQRLRLAQKVGTVTLVLRSLEDRTEDAPLAPTREADLSQSGGGASPAAIMAESDSVLIRRGAPSEKKEQFSLESPMGGAGQSPRASGASSVDGRSY